tara:strand:+ start:845 stop:1057 length:213 start_codon:yes stop_codon:yes gene_type:complete
MEIILKIIVTLIWGLFISIGISSEIVTFFIEVFSFSFVESLLASFTAFVVIYCICSALKQFKQKLLPRLS